MSLGDNIKHLRLAHNQTLADLAERLGYKSLSTVAKWESGASEPPLSAVKRMSEMYRVSMQSLFEDDLAGVGRKMSKRSAITINVLGRVPAGIPLEAIEDVVDTEELDPEEYSPFHEYFGLIVQGDSMYPKYMDGDVIIVQVSEDAPTGSDVVVCVNGYDATLKTLIKHSDKIELRAYNHQYPPRFYTPTDEPVHILGFVRELRRKI